MDGLLFDFLDQPTDQTIISKAAFSSHNREANALYNKVHCTDELQNTQLHGKYIHTKKHRHTRKERHTHTHIYFIYKKSV